MPKGMDFSIRLVSNATESFLHWTYNNDPKSFKQLRLAIENEMPDIAPTALKPIFECIANYNMFYNAPIVLQSQQKLPEHMQYDGHTSGPAKYIGETTGLSPKKVEHFLTSYTAGFGRSALAVMDWATGSRAVNATWSDAPIIGGLFRTPYKNPRILSEYYDEFDEQTKQKPEGFNPKLYARMKNSQKAMSKLAKSEWEVLTDQRLDSDTRLRRQTDIQKKRIAMAERVMH